MNPSLSIPTRREVSEVVLYLPIPTSANRLYSRTRTGHVRRSNAYRIWQRDAGWKLQTQKPGRVSGQYALSVGIPSDARMDADNAAKATSDLLQAHGVIENDRLAQSVSLHRQSSSPEMIVRVTAWGAA